MTSINSLIEPFKDTIRHNTDMFPTVVQILLDENPDLYTKEQYEEALSEFVSNDVLIPTSEPITITEIEEEPSEDSVIPTISLPSIPTKKPKFKGSRYVGLPRRGRERMMMVVASIDAIVHRHPQGITKTDILKAIRKDNSHGREEITTWISEMVDDGVIKSDGIRYYPHNIILRSRERNLHRTLYELLGQGSKTLTNLYIATGCNGGRNRYFVRNALSDLEKEGYIKHENKRWSWK